MPDLRGLAGDRYAVLALGVFGALGLVVLGVGAVAMVAELGNTWTYYFMLERTVALATPVTTALLALALLVGLGAVARA